MYLITVLLVYRTYDEQSRDCTLILTEGDSAKALAISGLGVVGRAYSSVLPLKERYIHRQTNRQIDDLYIN